MPDNKDQPLPWIKRKERIRRRWMTPFLRVEWLCEWIAFGLSRWAFVDVLDYAGRFTILVTVVVFFVSAHYRRVEEQTEAIKREQELVRQTEQQRKAKHYQAWQMLNSAAGKAGDAGRSQALVDLYGDGVSFKRIDLQGAVLTDIQLDTNGPVDFQNATLNSCQLDDAQLRGVNFRAASLVRAVLSNANCARGDFEKANLDHASLNNAVLTDANFMSASLVNAIFIGARLDGAKFKRADLHNANLTAATLTNADLSATSLSNATVKKAFLLGANLTKANLAEATFDGADLRGADFNSVEDWRDIKSMRNANIHGIRHAPDDFKKWARDHGAIEKP